MINPARPRLRHLHIALLGSLLFHALLLSAFRPPTTTLELSAPDTGGPMLLVTVAQSKPIVVKNTHQGGSRRIRQAAVAPHTESSPARQIQTVAKKPSMEPADITNDMIRYIETEFRTRFQYPMVARKFGWQGKVVVGLDVNHAGVIHNIKVKQSSGYAVLDNNAVETFQQIGTVLPGGYRQNHRDYQFSIPVIYQLIKG